MEPEPHGSASFSFLKLEQESPLFSLLKYRTKLYNTMDIFFCMEKHKNAECSQHGFCEFVHSVLTGEFHMTAAFIVCEYRNNPL
jgi:hypothetical protein